MSEIIEFAPAPRGLHVPARHSGAIDELIGTRACRRVSRSGGPGALDGDTMIMGHYATALIPHSRDRRTPLGLYLFAAMMQDAVWLVLAAAGLERVSPDSVWKASFANLRVEAAYSHDLLPSLGWALIAAMFGFVVTRRLDAAAWCALLSAGHEALDLLSGFHHHVAGPATARIGLNLYGRAPYLALVIEAAFSAAMVFAYDRSESRQGRALATRKRIALYAVFVLGSLALLPGAEQSLSSYFE